MGTSVLTGMVCHVSKLFGSHRPSLARAMELRETPLPRTADGPMLKAGSRLETSIFERNEATKWPPVGFERESTYLSAQHCSLCNTSYHTRTRKWSSPRAGPSTCILGHEMLIPPPSSQRTVCPEWGGDPVRYRRPSRRADPIDGVLAWWRTVVTAVCLQRLSAGGQPASWGLTAVD